MASDMTANPVVSGRKPAETASTRKGRLLIGWTPRIALLLAIAACSAILFSFDLGFLPVGVPIIADDLALKAPEWIGASYAIAVAAFLPWSNCLAKIYGRRDTLLASIAIFSIGNIVCAAAYNEAAMLSGRVIAGIGSAGVTNLSAMLMVDILPLSARGLALGVQFSGVSLGFGLGPLLAGAFGRHWRFIFIVQVPLSMACFVALFFAGRGLGRPQLDRRQQLRRIDWLGNIIALVALTGFALALSWAGSQYSWGSAPVLVPLVGGIALFGVFIAYELRLVYPTLPFHIFVDRTTVLGYLGCVLHHVVQQGCNYAVVIWLQTVKLKTPLDAAMGSLAFLLFGQLFAIPMGIYMNRFQTYCWENIIAYFVMGLGCIFLALLKEDSPTIAWVGSFLFTGLGSGALYQLEDYPTLSSLPANLQGDGSSFINLTNAIGQLIGLSITVTVLQSWITPRLPVAFTSTLSNDQQLLFRSVEPIRSITDPVLQLVVRRIFVKAFSVLFYTLAGVSVLMLVCACFFRPQKLHEETDPQYDFEHKQQRVQGIGEEEKIELDLGGEQL